MGVVALVNETDSDLETDKLTFKNLNLVSQLSVTGFNYAKFL